MKRQQYIGPLGDYPCSGVRCIRRLIAERRIDYIKLGRHVRVQRSVLNAFIESDRSGHAPDVRRPAEGSSS